MSVSAKKKPGKVLRVDELTFNYISEKKRRGEKLTSLMRRLLGLPSRRGVVETPTKYVLPSDIYATAEEARGAAVLKAVRSRKKETEEPTPVREIV